MARSSGNSKINSTANLGFEAKLRLATDKLRSNWKRRNRSEAEIASRRLPEGRAQRGNTSIPSFGLIFLNYNSDSFEEKHAELTKEPGADPEDQDEYKAENVFWVPPAP